MMMMMIMIIITVDFNVVGDRVSSKVIKAGELFRHPTGRRYFLE
jgi:hypothetical protein